MSSKPACAFQGLNTANSMERGVDVLLGRRSREDIDSELLIEHLMEEKLKVVVSSTHPLAVRGRVDWTDLTGESWILAATDSVPAPSWRTNSGSVA